MNEACLYCVTKHEIMPHGMKEENLKLFSLIFPSPNIVRDPNIMNKGATFVYDQSPY